MNIGIRACDFLAVSLKVEIIGNFEGLALCEGSFVSIKHTSTDLGSLSVEHNSADLVGSLLKSSSEVVERSTMRLSNLK